jgi:NADH:ubiquinone oxidoreductase subunit E
MEDSTVEKLEKIHCRFKETGGNIIAVLQDIQSEFRYIPEDTVYWFSRKTGIPASKFYGVITFYSQFHTRPRGENIVTVCCGTVCHVKGSQRIFSRLREEFGLKGKEDTSRDGKFTLEKVACVGACSIAPVSLINSTVYGNMNPDKMIKQIKKHREGSREK